MFSRLRERFAAFMQGRYGPDRLYYWSIGAVLVIWVLRAVFLLLRLTLVAQILDFAAIVLIVLASYRVFSKNIYKRREENRRFSAVVSRAGEWFGLVRNRIKERKTNVYRKCPHCKAVLRLPRERGVHTVKCPKCSERFSLKIR